jgi:hypothetical protein
MSDPVVQFCYSKDGGNTWSNWRERSLGAVGRFNQRVRLLNLGQTRSIVLKIRVADPVKRDILGGNASVSPER